MHASLCERLLHIVAKQNVTYWFVYHIDIQTSVAIDVHLRKAISLECLYVSLIHNYP